MIEFKSPTAAESAMMSAFGDVIGQAIDLIVAHELGPVGLTIVQKLQEAMFWHSHYLLNRDAPVEPTPPLEGEVLTAKPTVQ